MDNSTVSKVGTLPETLMYTGKYLEVPVGIEEFSYNSKTLRHKKWESLEEYVESEDKEPDSQETRVTIFTGLHNVKQVAKFGQLHNIHGLILEDVLNVRQRPKIEDHWDYHYAVLHALSYNLEEHEIYSEQISLILNDGHIIIFLEKPGAFFDPVFEKLRSPKGKIKKRGEAFLFYLLLDAIVDSYYAAIEGLSEDFFHLEELVEEGDFRQVLSEIHYFKREIQSARRKVLPVKDLVNNILKMDGEPFDEFYPFFKDLHDHSLQIIDSLAGLDGKTRELREMLISINSYKLNEIMKTLTVMATIFLPLTFIVGVYGMNFENMPELTWPWAYYACLMGMLIFSIVMMIYMKKKKWF